MIRPRGYTGSVSQLRRFVAKLRPPRREAFLRLHTSPGEQAQADWAHFGEVTIGRARRRLSAFLLTLSYSRALWLEFFLAPVVAVFQQLKLAPEQRMERMGYAEMSLRTALMRCI
jgi:transposase